MVVLFLTAVEFISATGSWSTHSGFGAFTFFCLFCAVLGWGLVLAYMAPSWYTVLFSYLVRTGFGKTAGTVALNIFDIIDILATGFGAGPAVMALIAFIAYLCGFGAFADGGWMLSSAAHLSGFDYFALGYIAFSNWSFYKRMNGLK